MAYTKIPIVQKFAGTPTEISVTSTRIAAPTIIQPSYTFDVSNMYGIFLPNASLGYGLEWDYGLLDVCIGSFWPSTTKLVKEASLGTDFSWNAGYLEVVGGTGGASALGELTDVSLKSIMPQQVLLYDGSISKWTNKIAIDASLLTLGYENITNYFYTKAEVDAIIAAVVGGYY